MTCVKCGRSGSRGFDGDTCKAVTVCEKRAAKRHAAMLDRRTAVRDAVGNGFVDVELPFGVAAEPVRESAYDPFGEAAPADLTLIFGVADAPVDTTPDIGFVGLIRCAAPAVVDDRVAVIDLERRTRDCVRCGFTLPIWSFPLTPAGYGRQRTCDECQPGAYLFGRIATLAVDMRLRVIAAGALLHLGCPRAAALVLDHRDNPTWPRLNQARAMQRRSV